MDFDKFWYRNTHCTVPTRIPQEFVVIPVAPVNEHLEDPEGMEKAIEGVKEMLEEEPQPEEASREENQAPANPHQEEEELRADQVLTTLNYPQDPPDDAAPAGKGSTGAQEHKGDRWINEFHTATALSAGKAGAADQPQVMKGRRNSSRGK